MIDAAADLEGQLIATQTELESLKQIYTDNNVRVRATQAKADELRRQLRKIGGAAPGDGAASVAESKDSGDSGSKEQPLYPSIRELPILGVNYADLYRQTKVEEAVYETLTQQYELAKVEEAKETPSVKVLDPPDIPEKKSSPHRVWIMLGGMLLSFGGAAVWVLGGTSWKQLGADDPGKVLALEVYQTVKAHLPTVMLNGAHANGGGPDSNPSGEKDSGETRA